MTTSSNDTRLYDELPDDEAGAVVDVLPAELVDDDPDTGDEMIAAEPTTPLGLVGLHELADPLRTAGFEVVSDPDLKAGAQLLQQAVRIWREEAGDTERLPVLMLNSPQLAGLIPRVQRHVALTLLGTQEAPVVEAEGYRTYQLPGSVRDILKNAGVDGYDAVPEGLELQADGSLFDSDSGWDDWTPDDAPVVVPAGTVLAADAVVEAENPADLGDSVFGVRRTRHLTSGLAGRIGLGNVLLTLSGSGGVGKSSFSLAVAARAAERGLRVVLVDGNLGQGDLSAFLRVTGHGLPTMYDAIVDGRNLQAGIVTPAQLADARTVGMRKPCFALLQAPSVEELRTGRISSAVVDELVEESRRIADLVVVDTQIVETDDPRGMVANLVLPQLGKGGWAVAIAGLSTAGLANLNRLLTDLEAEGINGTHVLSLLARMPVGVDIDHEALVAALRRHSVHLGTAWVDDGLQTALNHGDTLAEQPALANLVDTVLNRMFDLPVVAPAHTPGEPVEPKRRAWSRWFDRKRSA